MWVLFQVHGKRFAYGLLYRSCHFAVSKFGFGLSFKLWLGNLDAYDCCKSFAEVLTADLNVVFLQFFHFLGELFLCILL